MGSSCRLLAIGGVGRIVTKRIAPDNNEFSRPRMGASLDLFFHKPAIIIDAGGGGLFGLVREITHF